tara:strand:- start:403 stop:588 length:186 start_codon:yes stop_codon:yes gene_type:complete
MKPDYEAAFNILMEYWDFLPEEEHTIIDEKLNKVLNDEPTNDCIKRTLDRLKEEFGFGIPD